MQVIPAIDLRGGRVVRLMQGVYDRQTVYGDNPEEIARSFAGQGACRIHLVDLDGARDGRPRQADTVKRLAETIRAEFQVGGGIRDTETAGAYLAAGLSRVVLGTRACLDKFFLQECLGAFGEKVIVGVDARDGFVATDGWTKLTDIPAEELVDRAAGQGAREVIYTDISRDGTLTGPNFVSVKKILDAADCDIIASGGIAKTEDLRQYMEFGTEKLVGVIIGKALYEGTINLKEAVELCR